MQSPRDVPSATQEFSEDSGWSILPLPNDSEEDQAPPQDPAHSVQERDATAPLGPDMLQQGLGNDEENMQAWDDTTIDDILQRIVQDLEEEVDLELQDSAEVLQAEVKDDEGKWEVSDLPDDMQSPEDLEAQTAFWIRLQPGRGAPTPPSLSLDSTPCSPHLESAPTHFSRYGEANCSRPRPQMHVAQARPLSPTTTPSHRPAAEKLKSQGKDDNYSPSALDPSHIAPGPKGDQHRFQPGPSMAPPKLTQPLDLLLGTTLGSDSSPQFFPLEPD